MYCGHLDYFKKPRLGGKPNTKPGGHGTLNTHNRQFMLFYRVWRPTWIEIRWYSIWLGARSRMTSHYTWGSMARLHDFRGVLGQPLGTFLWALPTPMVRPLDESQGNPPLLRGHNSWLMWKVALKATSHTSQEPWPWHCESPKQSVPRPSQHTSESCSMVTDLQV